MFTTETGPDHTTNTMENSSWLVTVEPHRDGIRLHNMIDQRMTVVPLTGWTKHWLDMAIEEKQLVALPSSEPDAECVVYRKTAKDWFFFSYPQRQESRYLNWIPVGLLEVMVAPMVTLGLQIPEAVTIPGHRSDDLSDLLLNPRV